MEKVRQALDCCPPGERLSFKHFAVEQPPESQIKPKEILKPQTGLGMRRSSHKPIPRKMSSEEAETMRALHGMGLGYRALGKAFNCAPGCAHHAVTKRGAYKHD